MAIDRALMALKGPNGRVEPVIERIIAKVRLGGGLPCALYQAKCISEYDFAVLQVAEQAGALPAALDQLTRSQVGRAQRLNNFKANLVLPKMLLIIGALAGVLVRVYSVGQPVDQALISVLIVLFWSWLVMSLSIFLIRLNTAVWLSLLWRVPIIMRQYKTLQLMFEQLFYRALTWQIVAGIPVDRALGACETLLTNLDYKQSVGLARRAVNRGEQIHRSLQQSGLCLSAELRQVMGVANDAGVWEQAVTHHLDLQARVLALKADDFFKWLPRLYYLLALSAISKFMLA